MLIMWWWWWFHEIYPFDDYEDLTKKNFQAVSVVGRKPATIIMIMMIMMTMIMIKMIMMIIMIMIMIIRFEGTNFQAVSVVGREAGYQGGNNGSEHYAAVRFVWSF